MSLFPAYAGEDHFEDCEGGSSLSPGAELALLEDEPRAAPAPPSLTPAAPRDSCCYEDRRLDTGNLRVSTLYYPGRPEYRARSKALGGGYITDKGRRRERARRYWRAAAEGGADHDAQCAARAAALRAALQQRPTDEHLWLQYIDFLEWCGRAGGETAGEAAERGVRECTGGGGGRGAVLRDALHALVPPAQLVTLLRDLREHIHNEALSPEAADALLGELWAREVSARAGGGGGGGGAELGGAAAAAAAAASDRALRDHAHLPLLAYGAVLRSAGLGEKLTQLIELVAAMNFPSSGVFPPAESEQRHEAGERQLAQWEGVTARCGLPAGAVWARLERVRGALHWRAPPPGADLGGDPQRAPPPADLAPLLRAASSARASYRLLVTLLRLAEAPLLPLSAAAARGAAGGVGAALVAASWERACGAGLLALLRAARRARPAHAARRALSAVAARRLLADTPLRAQPPADTTGFGSWCTSLWEAALQWSSSSARRQRALLCWRLRVLHARVLIHTDDEESVKRIRSSARDLLRRYAGDAVTPYVVFARIEAAAGGGGGRVAVQALRGALRQGEGGQGQGAVLHAARVVGELAPAGVARWALLCAAAGRPLPTDAEMSASEPPRELLHLARERCRSCCAALERRYLDESVDTEEEADEAMLPSDAEWGAVRVLLAEPKERTDILRDLLTADCSSGGARLARYREQTACALVAAGAVGGVGGAGRGVIRALAELAPLNGYLALAREGAAGGGATGGELWVLADTLPALLRAASDDWPPHEARVVERGLSRGGGGGGAAGGALAAALRLAAAGVAGGAGGAALTRALDAAPHCHHLYVRGAALGAPVAELADLLLERGLRLHVLPDELPLLADLPATTPDTIHKQAQDSAP